MSPERKVWSGGLAGGLTIIIVWVTQTFAGIEIPAEVASALTAVISSLTAYLVPNPT